VRGVPVPLPPLQLQRDVTDELNQLSTFVNHAAAECGSALARASALRQGIFKKAFSGQLVPRDLNDESASALLDRIRAARAQSVPAQARKQPRKKVRA
jgi:type I restriction enzyme S subunit